jgi:hypothetical protein
MEQPLGLKRFHVQAIEERPIALRRRARPGEIQVVAVLHDRGAIVAASAAASTAASAVAAVAPRHRRAVVVIRGVLPAIP